jgi:hypothetical protein
LAQKGRSAVKSFLQRRWKWLLLGALAGLLVFVSGTSLFIGHQVKEAVAEAQKLEPGDPVLALMKVAEDDELGLKQRNSAIWALGQLGNPRALPVLEKLQTGRECRHDLEVCQKEVVKAIAACRGTTNLTAIFWRHGELAGK